MGAAVENAECVAGGSPGLPLLVGKVLGSQHLTFGRDPS